MRNKKMLEGLFKILLKLMNKTHGHGVGEWNMDYIKDYGGWIIVEYMENGGENHPLLQYRLPLKELISCIEMTIRTLKFKEET